jgi:soluble cytochrome b562
MPAAGDAAYLLRLKNGGELTTDQYWLEGGQIFFFYAGGIAGIEKGQIAGIEKQMVKRIEKTTIDGEEVYEIKEPEKPPAEAEQKAEKDLSPQTPPEKIDLKAYQDKMAKLKTELNKTLTRIKKANTNNDSIAKDEATEDNRRISAEMWKLTDELEKKNSGKLPADWWEGVGREEPAVQ